MSHNVSVPNRTFSFENKCDQSQSYPLSQTSMTRKENFIECKFFKVKVTSLYVTPYFTIFVQYCKYDDFIRYKNFLFSFILLQLYYKYEICDNVPEMRINSLRRYNNIGDGWI